MIPWSFIQSMTGSGEKAKRTTDRPASALGDAVEPQAIAMSATALNPATARSHLA
jgi:hypothetical protein